MQTLNTNIFNLSKVRKAVFPHSTIKTYSIGSGVYSGDLGKMLWDITLWFLSAQSESPLFCCSLLRADYCQKQGVVLCHHHLTHHTHSGHHPRYMFCIRSVEPWGPFCLVIHMEGLRVPAGWQRRCMRPAFHYPCSFGFLTQWFLLAQSESPLFCLCWTIWSPVFGALTCLNRSLRINLTLSSLTFTPVSDPQLYSFFFFF